MRSDRSAPAGMAIGLLCVAAAAPAIGIPDIPLPIAMPAICLPAMPAASAGPATQPGQHRVGIAVQPVAQHDDIVAIVAQGLLLRLDHDGAVQPGLLLQPDMRVVPVGAALPDRVLVEEDLLRRHGRHRQVGHAVHRRGHQQAVPMDTGRLVGQIVLQLHAEQLALAQAELWARHAPACRDRPHRLPPVGVELGVADLQTAEPGRGTRAWHHGRGIGGSSGNTRLEHPGNAEAGQRGAGRPEQLAPTQMRIAAEYGRCLIHFRRSLVDDVARRTQNKYPTRNMPACAL